MPGLLLLPGEREVMRLRPHPSGFATRYFAALLPALWGLALWAMVRSTRWTPSDAAWWQVWHHIVGHAWNAYVIMILGLALLGAAAWLVTGRQRWFVGALALAAALVLLAALWGISYKWSLPGLLWATAPPAVALTEWHRRSHSYILTNLRMVLRGGMVLRREWQAHYEQVTDLDGRQGPLGALLGYGTLLPVTRGEGPDAPKRPSGARRATAGTGDEGGRGRGVDKKAKGKGAGRGTAGAGAADEDAGVARGDTVRRLVAVRPYDEVRQRLAALIQEATITSHLRKQAGRPGAADGGARDDIPVLGGEDA